MTRLIRLDFLECKNKFHTWKTVGLASFVLAIITVLCVTGLAWRTKPYSYRIAAVVLLPIATFLLAGIIIYAYTTKKQIPITLNKIASEQGQDELLSKKVVERAVLSSSTILTTPSDTIPSRQEGMHEILQKEVVEKPAPSLSSVPVEILLEICKYLSFESLACFLSTAVTMQQSVHAFFLREWKHYDLECSTYEELSQLSKEYFCDLVEEVKDIDKVSYFASNNTQYEEMSSIFCYSLVASYKELEELSAIAKYQNYPQTSFSIQIKFASFLSRNILERPQSPLARLYVLKWVEKQSTNRYILPLITRAYRLRCYNTIYGNSPLSELKLFKWIKKSKLRREGCDIPIKMDAIKSVLQSSSIEEIDIGMLTILLQNDAFSGRSHYPSRFIHHVLQQDRDHWGSYAVVEGVLDLFYKYNISLDIADQVHPYTPVQVAGLVLIKKVLFLKNVEESGAYTSGKTEKLFSQIQISAKIIKFLIEKGVNREQEIISEEKDGTTESRSLLGTAQEALLILKSLKKQHTEIMEDLRDIIRACTPSSNVESARTIASLDEEK
jgi:hypothetical protein